MSSRLVLPILLAASSLTVMAGATIAPSLPGLRAHFAATPDVDIIVKLVLTIPGLAIALMAPLAGGIADRFGRLPVLLVGIVLYAVSGAAGLVLDDLASILVSRVLLGIAVGMIMTAASALIADFYAGPERERALRWQAAFMGYGGVLFLIGGGFLAEWSWRGPFAIYLLPLVLLPLIRLRISEPARAAPVEGAPLDAFPWSEIATVLAFAFAGMIVFYVIPVQLPFLLQSLGSPSPTLAGMGIATGSLLSATASLFLLRHVRARLSLKMTLALSFLLIGLGYLVVWAATTPVGVFAGVAFAGLGLGLQMPMFGAWLQGAAPPSARGRAAGLLTMAMFFGQFVSPIVHGPTARLFGYGGSFAAAALLSFVTGAMLALLARRPG